MRASTHRDSKDVRGETVPEPIIIDSDDVILKVTATAICGLALHINRDQGFTFKMGLTPNSALVP